MKAANLDQILSLEVPIIVRIGKRKMTLGEVVALIPGMIIELPKRSDEDLDLLVNNKPIGQGSAVKVGENFGIKLASIGNAKDRIQALGATGEGHIPPDEASEDPELLARAEDELAGR